VHRRRFSLEVARGALTIRDELAGDGTHSVESLLHLAAGAQLHRVDETTFDLKLEARARIAFTGVGAGEIMVEDGWISDRYGKRERALVLVVSTRRAFPTVLSYTITPL
jgi:hypothetical protein